MGQNWAIKVWLFSLAAPLTRFNQKPEARGPDDATHKGQHRDMEQRGRWRSSSERLRNRLAEVPPGDSGTQSKPQRCCLTPGPCLIMLWKPPSSLARQPEVPILGHSPTLPLLPTTIWLQVSLTVLFDPLVLIKIYCARVDSSHVHGELTREATCSLPKDSRRLQN